MKKNARIGMRIEPQDKLRWEQAAARANMSLSAWISAHLDRAALQSEQRKLYKERI